MWAAMAYRMPPLLVQSNLVQQPKAFITDPVYEGKSLAGMMDMVRKGEIENGKTVLFAQLGSQLALNAYELHRHRQLN